MEVESIKKQIKLNFSKEDYHKVSKRIDSLFGSSGDLTTYVWYLLKKDMKEEVQ